MFSSPLRPLALTAALLAAGLPSLSRGSHVRPPAFVYVLAQAPLDPLPTPDNDQIRPVEKTFVVDTLGNARREIELSRLALSQASNSEVREFAQQLITDATQADIALETLARRKAIAVPVEPTSNSQDYRELSQRPGASFDRDFIRRMSDSSDRLLRLCELAVENAKDSDVRAFAGNLLPVVRAHVNRITDLQKSL